MSSSKGTGKSQTTKARSASGSKTLPGSPLEDFNDAPKKSHGSKKRVTIEEARPDPQSFGDSLPARASGPILEIAETAASSAAGETKGLPGSRSGPTFSENDLAKDLPVFDEPIHNSITRYHEPFDPLVDNDPLEEFGAVGGLLPDRPPEEAMILLNNVVKSQMLNND
ncbi:hypothetical protein CPC08DRAFT_769848 [Agrocybe pediades]|nr:hypothetical protein CPC08DRAFT_769848 [Agrocybe pediades]